MWMIGVPVTNGITNPIAISAGTAASPSADDTSSCRRRPRSTRSRSRMLRGQHQQARERDRR